MSEPEARKLADLRELIPATGAGIYLDTAYRGPLPAETAAAMREADDWELRVGRATEGREDDFEQRVEEARAVLAALLHVDAAEMVITSGVDAALAFAARIAPRHSLAVVHQVDPDTGRSSLGRGIPESHDLWVAAEASLAVGAIPIEAAAIGADFVVFAADRWLLGPEETGAVWLGPRARAAGMDTLPSIGLGRTAEIPGSFGVGRTAVLGLARSVGWLEMYVGLEWAFQRSARLAGRLRTALDDATDVTLLTPAGRHATTIVFRLDSWPVDQALGELRRRVFAIVGSTPDGEAIRASVAWFNTEAEIDRFAAAVAEIARHTPDSLPRRPPLIVH